jgi:hypothetical protein
MGESSPANVSITFSFSFFFLHSWQYQLRQPDHVQSLAELNAKFGYVIRHVIVLICSG